jgi:hypothetical protein
VEAEQYVHVLLFQCRNCERPLTAPVVAPEKNPEQIDAAECALKCICSWSGLFLGAEALRHWIVDWRGDGMDRGDSRERNY